jgi:hypothetical protein
MAHAGPDEPDADRVTMMADQIRRAGMQAKLTAPSGLGQVGRRGRPRPEVHDHFVSAAADNSDGAHDSEPQDAPRHGKRARNG